MNKTVVIIVGSGNDGYPHKLPSSRINLALSL